METATMGKVLVTAKLENHQDLYMVKQKMLDPTKVRSIEVADAVVDTERTLLSVPTHLIEKLGLTRFKNRPIRTNTGVVQTHIYGVVQLTIQGRDCVMDVAEVPDDCPVLIGRIPLLALDWVVDPIGQKLVGNPEHGGEWMIEQF